MKFNEKTSFEILKTIDIRTLKKSLFKYLFIKIFINNVNNNGFNTKIHEIRFHKTSMKILKS